MGLFSAIAGIFGGGSAKRASRAAEAAQIAAQQQAIGEQRRQFDVTQQNLAPATSQLAPSIGAMSSLIGLGGPEAQAAALQALQGSPELAAIVRNGEDAILANASATGGLRGGNTQDALSRFRGDAFAQLIAEQYRRLGGMANIGLGAAGAVAGYGANTADNVSSLMTQQGQARAQGLLTRGGINSQIWNNVGSSLDRAVQRIPVIGSLFG